MRRQSLQYAVVAAMVFGGLLIVANPLVETISVGSVAIATAWIGVALFGPAVLVVVEHHRRLGEYWPAIADACLLVGMVLVAGSLAADWPPPVLFVAGIAFFGSAAARLSAPESTAFVGS